MRSRTIIPTERSLRMRSDYTQTEKSVRTAKCTKRRVVEDMAALASNLCVHQQRTVRGVGAERGWTRKQSEARVGHSCRSLQTLPHTPQPLLPPRVQNICEHLLLGKEKNDSEPSARRWRTRPSAAGPHKLLDVGSSHSSLTRRSAGATGERRRCAYLRISKVDLHTFF
jgi:hypothetical protein